MGKATVQVRDLECRAGPSAFRPRLEKGLCLQDQLHSTRVAECSQSAIPQRGLYTLSKTDMLRQLEHLTIAAFMA